MLPFQSVDHDAVPMHSELETMTPQTEELYCQSIMKMVSTEATIFSN